MHTPVPKTFLKDTQDSWQTEKVTPCVHMCMCVYVCVFTASCLEDWSRWNRIMVGLLVVSIARSLEKQMEEKTVAGQCLTQRDDSLVVCSAPPPPPSLRSKSSGYFRTQNLLLRAGPCPGYSWSVGGVQNWSIRPAESGRMILLSTSFLSLSLNLCGVPQ
jgi:hypothetical protein